MSDNAPKTLPTPETHPNIFKLAREIGRPISFFDLETTTHMVNAAEFGITEFAFLAILPEGKAHAHAKLLNPENPISFDAERITGISQTMVEGQPTFAEHAEKVLRMMERSLMVGFNCNSFDTVALIGQLDRYGIARPAEWTSVDLRDIWRDKQKTQKGTQSAVAEHYGVPFEGAHRAFADCSALADILEQMIWRHGVEAFHGATLKNAMGPSKKSEANGSSTSSRAVKPEDMTPNQIKVKEVIDAAIAKNQEVAAFAADLAAAGFKLEIVKNGARYIPQEAGAERVTGSQLGEGYGWPAVLAKLSGPIPQECISAGPIFGVNKSAAPSSTPEERAARQSQEAQIKAMINEMVGANTPIDTAKIAAETGAKSTSISFALSTMLAEGHVPPVLARDEASQAWLDSKWTELPTSGQLKPLLEACKAAGAPEQLDYTQLRVAIVTRKIANGEPLAPIKPPYQPRKPASAPARSNAPANQSPPDSAHTSGTTYASPRASQHDALSEAPPFDDIPFDDIPFDQNLPSF